MTTGKDNVECLIVEVIWLLNSNVNLGISYLGVLYCFKFVRKMKYMYVIVMELLSSRSGFSSSYPQQAPYDSWWIGI